MKKFNKQNIKLILAIVPTILLIAIMVLIILLRPEINQEKFLIFNPPQTTATTIPTSQPEVKKVANTTFNIPIYMYHHIQDVDPNGDQLAYGLSLSIANFEEEMQYLKTNHYETLTLTQMLDTLLNKKVSLTFDDGYIDVIQNAYPIMKKDGFTGTIFAITDLVGTPGYMTWEDLKTLQSAGWEIGSHTVTHPDLAQLNMADANYQITQSKKVIEQKLGIKVKFFCYPSGKYNDETISLLKAAGYVGATTTQYGEENSINNIYELQRIRLNGGATLNNFTGPL